MINAVNDWTFQMNLKAINACMQMVAIQIERINNPDVDTADMGKEFYMREIQRELERVSDFALDAKEILYKKEQEES